MIAKINIKQILFYIFFINYSTYCLGNLQEADVFGALVQEASAVFLLNDKSVNILSEYSIEFTVHKKILIKNKKAEDYCTVVINESEYQAIQDIEAKLVDIQGNEIKELDSDDIGEAELSPGYVFYSGKKYSWFKLTHHTYPYIIDYTYTMELESLFFWPDWYPQSNVPCLSSTYKLLLSKEVEFDYFNVGIDITPTEHFLNAELVYTWHLKNIPPRNIEDFMPPEYKRQMVVYFKPKNFQISNFNGSFESWSSLGKWYKNLTEGRYRLPAKAHSEFQKLVVGIEDPREKVKVLYNYLQNKNRYVAIELGIGGWQPQSAAEVYENRYGDCKDLSTIMVSMLDAVGIKSYPALALTKDRGEVIDNFPSNQFNHCITFVPLENDTIWLECTSSYTDMEDTPYSIEDIYVLVVKDNGGELIKTPQKNAASNHRTNSLYGKLGNKGDLPFFASIKTTGNRKNYFKQRLEPKNKQDDIIFLQNNFGRNYSNLNINDYVIEAPQQESFDYNIEINGVYNKFNPKRGSRIFINPNIFSRWTGNDLPDEKIEERKYPVYYFYPYQDVDTVIIEISKRYVLESKPKNVSINNSFAQFSSEYEFNDNKLYYFRKMEIKNNIIPVELYAEYLDFLKKVIKSDKSKFVFKRK